LNTSESLSNSSSDTSQDSILKTRCGHFFHTKCLNEWVRKWYDEQWYDETFEVGNISTNESAAAE